MRILFSRAFTSSIKRTHFKKINMKFCANLSFMFNEKPMIDRYALAKNAGFKYVESGFPFGYSLEEVTDAKNKSGLEQILINIYTGDVSKGEIGVTYLPDKVAEFQKNLKTTIEYAKALQCSFIHIMAGVINCTITEDHWKTYESNLLYASQELKKENIIGLIEPINKYSVPGYFMNSFEKALGIVKKINSPHLRLMMDIFHLQHINGNITMSIKEMLAYVGHIQIAQVPNRNEPNTPGEINYKYVLDLLEKSSYDGYVGLEYKPLNGSQEGLTWINEFGYAL